MKKIFFNLCLLTSIYTYTQAQTLFVSGTGSLYVKGAANIDGNISSAPTLYVTGAIQNNGTLTNAGEMQQTGNFNNSGTFSSIGDNVFLTGATQNLSGAFTGSESFYNLIVNKAVNPVVLSTDVEVTNQVNLVNGKISVGSLNLTLAPTATMVGYDANDYIATSGIGTLRQTVSVSNVVFPVGASSYNPLTMSNAGTTDVFSVRVQNQVTCQSANPLATTAKVNRLWNVSEAVLGGSNATITVQWNTAEEDATFDRTQSGVTTYDSSVPTYMLSATNTAAANPSAGIYTQTETGQTFIGNKIVTSIAQPNAGGPTTFCNGGNVVLTSPSDALYTYQWQNGGTNISLANSSTYTADATGAYRSVITVNGTCTMTTAAISVTEQILPTPTIVFTNPASANDSLQVCAGTPVTMTCSSSPVSEYLWYRNGTAINYQISPNNTYTVGTANVGVDVYRVLIVQPGSVCLSELSAPLTIIKSGPNPIITPLGSTTFCANNPTTLSTITGMMSYTWRLGSTIVGTNTNLYTPTASGNHSVTVTDMNGCSKTSANINITRKTLPSAKAGIDKSVCIGSTVQIGGTAVINNTYSWAPATDLSDATLANPIASPSSNTSYRLFVSNTITGCSNSDTVNVSTLPSPPMPSLSSTQSGNLFVLTANSPNAVFINWYKNGQGLYIDRPVNSSITVAASNPVMAYTLRSKGANGCLSMASNAINVRLGGEKAGDATILFEENMMTAYPNPTTGLLNISLHSSEVKTGEILLYNTLGQVIFSQHIDMTDGVYTQTIDISHLAAGIYTLSFETEMQKQTNKVIKE